MGPGLAEHLWKVDENQNTICECHSLVPQRAPPGRPDPSKTRRERRCRSSQGYRCRYIIDRPANRGLRRVWYGTHVRCSKQRLLLGRLPLAAPQTPLPYPGRLPPPAGLPPPFFWSLPLGGSVEAQNCTNRCGASFGYRHPMPRFAWPSPSGLLRRHKRQ